MGEEGNAHNGDRKKRYVRKLTEVRRQQNRRAQRAFREKQRTLRAELQPVQQKDDDDYLSTVHELASKQVRDPSSLDLPAVTTGDSDRPHAVSEASQSPRLYGLEAPFGTDGTGQLNVIEPCPEFQSHSLIQPMDNCPPFLTTLAPAVLVPADPSVLDMRGMWPIPLECYQQTYMLPGKKRSQSRPFQAPPTLHPSPPLAIPGSTRHGESFKSQSSPALPDPFINHLQLLGESCFAATMSIALSLGFSRPSYINDHPSPFSLTPLADYANISADLQPTFEQRTLVHPRYLDCIIFPCFRSQAIELSSRGELDHCSLFLDLMHDGLICWGSQYASAGYGRSMSDAVPWSRHSWEARPWFLRKWSFLIGEEDPDHMRSISHWYSTIRGETEASDMMAEEVGAVFSRHGTCNVGVRQTYDDPVLW